MAPPSLSPASTVLKASLHSGFFQIKSYLSLLYTALLHASWDPGRMEWHALLCDRPGEHTQVMAFGEAALCPQEALTSALLVCRRLSKSERLIMGLRNMSLFQSGPQLQ